MAGVFKRSGKGRYYGTFVDHAGTQRTRSTKTTDKRAAEAIVRAWETEAAKRREGLIDPAAERFRDEGHRTLVDAVEEYLRSVSAAGRTEKHVEDTGWLIRRVADFGGCKQLREFTAEAV